ncbi:MAG: tripartite tricarboxylate transporter permease [Desulfobulbaceae bacterium]|nr:tripartite tricarboxylate transporter permease [Desulfobulbaceae bacterium]
MEYLDAFYLVLDPFTILFLFLGVFIGVIIGALPGLGSVVGITVCLPFTFGMDPVQAIALLLAVYVGTVYGGSIAAILINTPGTPQAAATAIEGYPMSKRGEGGQALGWATTASVIGGIFSCVILMFAAPQIAKFALRFGPIETFALIFLGLTCICSVSAGNLAKGLASGIIGLALATVGTDPISGDLRLTFDLFSLSSGITLIPVIVGIFALSEVLVQIENSTSGSKNEQPKGARIIFPTLKQIKGKWSVLLKSSAIGTGVGVLPGTGAATAAFMAYGEAQRSSKNKKNFGKGEVDGIIAAESSNNAVTGGALVPTLALGIPGDPVTAIMLATLTIHGITPGVRLMKDNPEMVYSTFLVLILANIFMPLAGIPIAKAFFRLLQIPKTALLSGIAVLSLLGSYGARGNSFDLLVAGASGVLGYIMRKNGFPLAPLVIGLVLGEQFELSLRQALFYVGDRSFIQYVLGQPLALILFGIAFTFLGIQLYTQRKNNKTEE